MAANSNKETNLQDDLLSFETLDRASPDLWPEQIPGVSTFAADKSSILQPSSTASNPPKWMADLENDDINLLQEFGSLTTSQLMEKVKGLQNLAYQLGLDEVNVRRRQQKHEKLPSMQRVKSADPDEMPLSSGSSLFAKVLVYQYPALKAREMTRGKFLQILQKPNKRQ